MSTTMVSAPFHSFLELFAVPGNSVGVSVPNRIKCPLNAKGERLLASYICDLRDSGAPDAEIEAVTALARHGHLRCNIHDSDFGDYPSPFCDYPSPFCPASEYTQISIAFHKAQIGFLRAENSLKCYLGLTSELQEIPDRYGEYPSEGRELPIPQLPKMTVEVHTPPSDEDASDILVYEAAPEHPRSVPLTKLTSIAQIADLTCDELDQYLKFYVLDVSEGDDHDTKLELLKKELGIDCVGDAEFNGESSTRDARRAVRSYLQLVGSQLTESEASLVQYDDVLSADEESPNDFELDVEGPCKMFRQRILASNILAAKYRNLLGPQESLGGDLVEVPDYYGNVPSGGRDVHTPAQDASRTPVHIPGVGRVVRYIVLAAIPEHPIVEPLPALTQMTHVLDLTPDQVDQYLKFYCVAVREDADNDQRLELLKVKLSISHIGPAYIRRYHENMLSQMKLAETLPQEKVAGIDVSDRDVPDMGWADSNSRVECPMNELSN